MKDDTISRQAAIDALISEINQRRDCDDLFVGDTLDRYDVTAILKGLPSAQPEQRWILCSERFPEHRLYVLVTYKYEYGLIDNGITWYSETENKWNTSREVIAWMPLPEPYRKEGDE